MKSAILLLAASAHLLFGLPVDCVPGQAAKALYWARRGYIILERLIDPPILDQVWAAYESAVAAGKIRLKTEPAAEGDSHPGRYLNPHKKVGLFCRILKHPGLLGWLRLLTEREPKPLQPITSHKGPQQAVHSDSIHMTTYPVGYLTAAWIAFEDIHPDSGPLVYYPGQPQTSIRVQQSRRDRRR